MISVRDLFQVKEDAKSTRNFNATTVKEDNSYSQGKTTRPNSGLQSAYITPKHLYGYFNDRETFQWSNPRFTTSKEAKLDYISLFGESGHPDRNLIKIYADRGK